MRSDRYLSEDAKRRELAEWEATKAEPLPSRPDRPDGLAGLGYPDPEIFEVCNRLNAIPGVCTLQSCAGHTLTDVRDGSKYVHAEGQLWLWLDPIMAAAFEVYVPDLAKSPLIERLRKLWLPDGQEIVDVEFTPGDRFTEATDRIVDFFVELRAIDGRASRAPEAKATEDAELSEFEMELELIAFEKLLPDDVELMDTHRIAFRAGYTAALRGGAAPDEARPQ